MGTKNNPGPFDCYANAGPDEPMFTLLARDKHAPALVWLWASLRELDSEDPEKVKEARECCVNMMQWGHDNGRKTAGFGQALLAGVLELIRTINHQNTLLRADDIKNKETDVDLVRRWMAHVNFGTDKEARAEKEAAQS